MKASPGFSSWISLGALIVVSTAAVAAEPEAATERTRAEVVSETLAARAAGALAPAGETPVPREVSVGSHSTLSRNAVESQVLEARATGTLIPAGEGNELALERLRGVSLVTRAEVKASVIAARRSGDLIPAGEGPDAETHARAKSAAAVHNARDESAPAQVANR